MFDPFLSFEVIKEAGETELLCVCPKCGEPKFYYNTEKNVGHCFRASCHYNFYNRDAPYLAHNKFLKHTKKESDISDQIRRMTVFIENELVPVRWESDVGAYLVNRRIGSSCASSVRSDKEDKTAYIIIRNEKQFPVSFVSRTIDKKTYRYPTNSLHSLYLFRPYVTLRFPFIILVENTFAALSFGTYTDIPTSTTFGSSVSKAQKELLKKYNEVYFLWDQGAEIRAQKYSRELQEEGVISRYGIIYEQPDHYCFKHYTEFVNALQSSNKNSVDLRKECVYAKSNCTNCRNV
jgi:predicted  nucleic acid-binding Zn-ribbon protein